MAERRWWSGRDPGLVEVAALAALSAHLKDAKFRAVATEAAN